MRHSAAREPCAEAKGWGLHAFESPHVAPPHARPIWRAEVHPVVLSVATAGAGAASDAFDLERLGFLSTVLTTAEGREHLLISDGLRTIRVDVLAGTLARGPVQLRYLLSGFASAERPLLTLRRFLALWRRGRFSLLLHPREARAKRWLMMLRAYDGLAAGADQREIAETLLSRVAGEPRWRSGAPSVRSQAQRLVRGARRMAAGGYFDLLR